MAGDASIRPGNDVKVEPEVYPEEHAPPLDPVDEAFARHAKRAGKRRKRKVRKMPGEEIAHLNLTPMMDIMTMLLVFLVMSFATEPANINVTLAMRPPESTTQVTMEPATKVAITKDVILVEDKEVVPLAEVKARSAKGEVSIAEVRDALLERADQLKALEGRGGAPFDGKLLVVADQSTPYAIVTAVLVTAGESKFSEYKLVLMQKGGQ